MTDNETQRPGSILGTRVLRTEDPGLLTGSRKYLADLDLENKLHAVFVRSEVAHGTISAVHADDARAMPGVVEILTAAELGVAPHHGFAMVHPDFARPPLADGRVRFVGEPIAVVLAETFEQGEDAAQAVWVDIDALPALVDAEACLADTENLIFPEHGSNEALVIVDKPRTDLVHCRRGRTRPLRQPTHGGRADGTRLLRGRGRRRRSTHVLGIDPDAARPARATRRRARDGAGRHPSDHRPGRWRIRRQGRHPPRVHRRRGAAARRTGRPVVWVPPRSDDMKALPHSRGQVQYVELGCTRDGDFTGLKVRLVGDAGAYPTIGAFLPGGTRRMAQGTYAFPAIEFDVAVAVTNTTPMGAYRGAGRPEATALLERLVDQAALELGIDPIEIRRRNFLGDDVFPFTTLTGNTYDSAATCSRSNAPPRPPDTTTLRAEQAERRANGDHRLLGIGVAAYVEITAGGGADEFGAIEVHDDGIGDDLRRHAITRPGSPDRVRHARRRPDRHPGRPHHARRRRHRPGAHRRWHRWLTIAAARRIGRARAPPRPWSPRPRSSLPGSSKPTSPTSSSTPRPARSVWPVSLPRHRLGRPRRPCRARRRATRRPVRLPPGRRHVSVRCPHRGGRSRRRNRQGPTAAPRGRRRLRHGARPTPRGGPTARRHRSGRRPGAVRGGHLRRRRQPA